MGKYWLVKCELDACSFDGIKDRPDATGRWRGVRNYQARNFIRDEMQAGDLAFFYHSNCAEPGIAGIAEVVREAYPDHGAFDARDPHYDPNSDPDHPRWYMVDIRLERKLKRLIPLDELKRHADDALRGFALLKRGNRLSVLPVSEKQWNFILSLE